MAPVRNPCRQPPRLSPGCGWLPDDWLNQDGLRAALRHISRQPMRRMALPSLGYAPLRAHIAATLGERGIAVDAQRVLLTQGATQGLDIVVRTLLRPGDTMAVEQPCYANLFPILRLAQVRAVPVPRAAGLDCVALERGAAAPAQAAVHQHRAAQSHGNEPGSGQRRRGAGWPRAMISTSSRTTSRASCWMAGPRRWRDWMARGA